MACVSDVQFCTVQSLSSNISGCSTVLKGFWDFEWGELSREAVCPLCHLDDKQAMVPRLRPLWLPSSSFSDKNYLRLHPYSQLPAPCHICLLKFPTAAQPHCYSAGNEWPGELGEDQGLSPSDTIGGSLNTDSWETHRTKQLWQQQEQKSKRRKRRKLSWERKQRKTHFCFNYTVIICGSAQLPHHVSYSAN